MTSTFAVPGPSGIAIMPRSKQAILDQEEEELRVVDFEKLPKVIERPATTEG